MGKSRIEYAAKNFASGTFSTLINGILGFLSQTIFIYTLGETYLGVNGLFTNILGMLSLAELGVGSAISFSLYKPLAENDTGKIQAIIHFYKNAYRIVALIVAALGLCILPFLDLIVKGGEGISNLHLIYCIFLFNTVSSYLISYKSTILSANQKNYLLTNMNLVIKTVAITAQIVVLLLFQDFIAYLLIDAAVQVCGKFYINYFVNKEYPYLRTERKQSLSSEERTTILTKVKALVIHKIGEVSIYQSDNIITSAFVNVTAVGLVSNFVLIIKMVNALISSFFNSATAGLGNLIATEGEEASYRVFKRYDYLGFVFYGWSAVVLYFCLSPFVAIWIGANRLIDEATVILLCVNYYLAGARTPLGNVKIAAGVYEQDKWVPLAQALTNIVVSVIGAKYWGLKGVYIGTLVSSMLPNILRPIIVYRCVFKRSCKTYFRTYLLRILFLLCNTILIRGMLSLIRMENAYLNFIVIAAVSAVVPLVCIYLVSKDSEEYHYALSCAGRLLGKLHLKIRSRGTT